MSGPQVKVSVIMPSYNRASIIARSIRSVLRQTRPDFELIVIDDASTDDTRTVVRSFEDTRIKFIQRPINHLKDYKKTGRLDNPRNDGLKTACGQYISYLDCDDMYRPDFLAEMTCFLDENPEVDLAYCNAVWHRNLDGKKETAVVALAVDFGPEIMKIRNIIGTCTVMHRREVVDKIGYFKPIKVRVTHPDATYSGIEDWDYWYRVSRHFRIKHHPLELAHYMDATSRYYLDPDYDPDTVPDNKPVESETPGLYHRITTAAEYQALTDRLSEIQGYLYPEEGYALMSLAAGGAGQGEIVEIGSFLGLSTCWLALGTQAGRREKVTAVDHFLGSKEHRKGRKHEHPVIVAEGTTFHRFMDNLKQQGLVEWVTPLAASSAEAARTWTRPIRLLFIDGDHSYEQTRQDFELWSPFVVSGGYVAFHDVETTWPGVTRFYHQILSRGEEWRQVLEVRSLRVIKRINQT